MRGKDLLDSLRQGEAHALERAIEEYGSYVAAVIRHTLSKTPRNEDVEELVADVFVSLWQHAARLAPDSQLKPWLAVVARNGALNWARGRARRPPEADLSFSRPLEADPSLPHPPEADPTATQVTAPSTTAPPDPLAFLAANNLIMDALDILDDENRRLVVSHYLEDRSISEIARMTGYSEPAVKSRLFRSRNTLRRHLRQKGIAS